MPFCHLQIKTLRCPHPDYWITTQAVPVKPKTIGEHIRKRRIGLHLLQKDLARELGVHTATVQNWEGGVGEPALNVLPKLFAFLGYDPITEPDALPAKVAYARRRLGLTQEQLAEALRVDPVTVYRWEKGDTALPTKKLEQIQKLLGDTFQLAPPCDPTDLTPQ